MPAVSDTSSDTPSTLSTSPASSPTLRQRPPPLRLDHLGDDPNVIVGKVLKGVKYSPVHPVITLDFTDDSTFQIRVDGYDPQYPGIPKNLETDPSFPLPADGKLPTALPITDCVFIKMTDKAFQRKARGGTSEGWEESQWDQSHLGVAFKFAEEFPRWHCVWATKQEVDEAAGGCVFRSYDDVFLKQLDRHGSFPKSPKARYGRHRRKASRSAGWNESK
ncbi:hypothetical protein HGRIS_002516 [Hohenbuehelia grisea]|uniref:Uncharacterized protein n=1 Tax=Hohenbuehelia grisea TaxID=104357 RepID=A0ABR3JLV3_9AGAR